MQRKVNIIFLVFLWAVVMVATAHSAEWRWNGYFGANYEDSTKANANGSFDTFVLSIITNVKIDENLRLVGQVDWEHAPYFEVNNSTTDATQDTLVERSSGEVTLSNAYGEYTVADYLKIKAGKFFTPVGLQNLVFYALPTYPYLKIPRESVYRKGSTAQTDATFFQRYAQGVWLAGDIPAALLSYDLHISNGKSDTDHADDNTTKGVGGRLQVNLTFGEVSVKPTASYYSDKFIETSRIKEQSTIIPGIDVTAGDLVVRGEYAASGIKNDSATGTKKFSAYYAEAYYTIAEKFTPYLRYELFEPNKDVADDKETETTVGVSYHIIPWVAQVKAQVRFHDYEKETPTNQAYNVYGIGLALGF